jgi:hypothetical protein
VGKHDQRGDVRRPGAGTWNDQTALRKSIAWTDEHTFNGLQAKVKRAIDFLSRAPA